MIRFDSFRFGYIGHSCELAISEIPFNGVVAVLGENGSGKTTFFESMLGLKPYSGDIAIDGESIKGKEFKYFSYIPQDVRCEMRFPTKDWILQGLAPYRSIFYSPTDSDFNDLEEVINKYKLLPREILDRDVSLLSGGEIRKAAIARALLQKTKYIIMDEIFSQLDPMAGRELRSIVDSLRDEGKTIFISIHDTRLIDYANGSIYFTKDVRKSSCNAISSEEVWVGRLKPHGEDNSMMIKSTYHIDHLDKNSKECFDMDDGYTLYTK
jgi:iron complex transport system ATP-binding protein